MPSQVRLILGDSLHVLPTLPAGSFDCIFADPPYGINTKSDGVGKLNPWADLVNSALWFREWIALCRALLKPNGCLWSCLNWRSMVTYQKAAYDLAWPIESMLVWDKSWIGPGGPRGLRPAYELVALWAMPEFAIRDRAVRDVQCFPWTSHKPHGHPAEKPLDLVRFCLLHGVMPGGRSVLDPFLGSGTSGVACAERGLDFVGVEVDPDHFQRASVRIGHMCGQGSSLVQDYAVA